MGLGQGYRGKRKWRLKHDLRAGNTTDNWQTDLYIPQWEIMIQFVLNWNNLRAKRKCQSKEIYETLKRKTASGLATCYHYGSQNIKMYIESVYISSITQTGILCLHDQYLTSFFIARKQQNNIIFNSYRNNWKFSIIQLFFLIQSGCCKSAITPAKLYTRLYIRTLSVSIGVLSIDGPLRSAFFKYVNPFWILAIVLSNSIPFLTTNKATLF